MKLLDKQLICEVCKYRNGFSSACDDCYSDASEFKLDEKRLDKMAQIVKFFQEQAQAEKATN